MMMMKNQEFQSQYQKIKRVGEGSFGKVYLYKRNQHREQINNKENHKQNSNIIVKNNHLVKPYAELQSTHYYALKKLKLPNNELNVQNLRQIQNLKLFKHKNLMSFNGIIKRDKGYKKNTYLVMDYGFQVLQFVKHKQLKISNTLLRLIVKQIVQGLKAIHDENYIHRDIKPDNIFVFPNGLIKIGDFSITRKLDTEKQMTGNIATRHYRPPELIFGQKKYSKQVDIWSLGCTIAQLILHQPIFPGQTDINQLECIFKIVGYPQKCWKKAQQLPYYFEFEDQGHNTALEDLLPNIDEDLLYLIKRMLTLDPQQRPTINQIFEHKYIKQADEDMTQLSKLSTYIYQKKISQYMSSIQK